MTISTDRPATSMPWHIDAPHALPASDVTQLLETNVGAGLSDDAAASRLVAVGPNRLREAPRPGLVAMLAISSTTSSSGC